jgi:hypothetical protein
VVYYFSQYATEDVIREELHPKTIGERTKNVSGSMKKEMEGRLWRQYWDAPGNMERCWYMVLRFD